MRLAAPLLLLLVAGHAAALSPPEPTFVPLTLHAQFDNSSGWMTRDPSPDGWTYQDAGLCNNPHTVLLVPSLGKPVVEDGDLALEGDGGLWAPLPVGASSVLDWRLEVPTGLSMDATLSAELHGINDPPVLSAQRSLTLSPGGTTHEATVGAVDVHRVELPLEADGAVRMDRISMLEVTLDAAGCLAHHHSSPGHRPTWDLRVGSPLQAEGLDYHDGAFRAWVGSAWGIDDVVLGDLRVRLPDGNVTLALTEFDTEATCHCGDDAYMHLARWEAPDPGEDWMAETTLGSAFHPDTQDFGGGAGDVDRPAMETPGLGASLLVALLGLAAVAVRRR